MREKKYSLNVEGPDPKAGFWVEQNSKKRRAFEWNILKQLLLL